VKIDCGYIVKADPINLALVVLVFVNTLAMVQFQALARSNPSGISKISTIEIAQQRVVAAIRN
jgi:hypothetical protein